MKSDIFKFRLRTFVNIEWMTHRLCKIKIMLSIQSISKEEHGRAARRVPKPMAYQWSWGSCRQMSGRKMGRSDLMRRQIWWVVQVFLFCFCFFRWTFLLENHRFRYTCFFIKMLTRKDFTLTTSKQTQLQAEVAWSLASCLQLRPTVAVCFCHENDATTLHLNLSGDTTSPTSRGSGTGWPCMGCF